MIVERIAGDGWNKARLLFDELADAQQDADLELGTPDKDGVFKGQFRDPNTGDPLKDELIDGRCVLDGLTARISFTRIHAGGNVTTRYVGRVIPLGNDTTVMIRGKFSRATTSNGTVSTAGGDYETEKPT
jgi:hypothetical protein